MTTLTPSTTVREVVEACAARSAFLDQIDIDPHRDGDRTLNEVCLSRDLSTSTVIDILSRMDRPPTIYTSVDESSASISELADHIVVKHHEYLRRELPRLQLLLDRVSPNEVVPHLDQIRAIFESYRSELEDHMAMEEQVLFPLIQEIDRASRFPGQYSGGINRSIAQSQHDHACFDSAMTHLRELTNNLTAPKPASTAYRSFLKGLADLEVDMRQHTYLEVDVLLPKAIEAETSLGGSKRYGSRKAGGDTSNQHQSAEVQSSIVSQ